MAQKNTSGIKKRKKGIATSNRILEVAAALFAGKGYDNVSVREIAAAAGIKESSLYNHYSSKAQILEILFGKFSEGAPQSRPSEAELEHLLTFMKPEEVFKHIVFYVGRNIDSVLENTAMIINYEKFRNQQAAEMYFKAVVNEPVEYYTRLINKMADQGLIKPVDARTIAEQYNYVSIALTKEYFMAKNGIGNVETVVKYMLKTLNFFCDLMKK